MMNKAFYYLIPLLLAGCNANPGKTPNEKIDFVVNKAFEDGDFIGSVLVAKKGDIIYRKNFGMADAEKGVPMSDSTKFLIASISKPVTAILILQLAEQGKVGLNDPLGKFFSVDNNSQASTVTVHQLLTHTSGIKELIGKDHAFEESDLEEADFDFKPGSDFKYSNTGYVILKEIAERASGEEFEELIAHICKSTQLNAFGVANDPHQVSNLALGYKATNQKETAEIGYPLEIVNGAGSLYATASDLFKIDRALRSESLLSKESIELMQKQHVKEKFGYGWFLRERGGVWDVMYHEGDLPGYTCFFSRRTRKDEAIILLSNVEGLNLSGLENDISRILKFDN